MKSDIHPKSYLKEIVVGVLIIVLGYYFTDGCGCNKTEPNSSVSTEIKADLKETNIKVDNGDYVAGDKIIQNVTMPESSDSIPQNNSFKKIGSNSGSKIIHQDKTWKDKKVTHNEDRSIKMENSPGSIANTGDNVIISQQIKSKYDYVPLSGETYDLLLSKFKAIKEKYGDQTPKIVIDFENNSSQIMRISEALAAVLEKSGLKVERRMGQYFEAKPCMKSHIVLPEQLVGFVNDFVDAFSTYCKSQLTGYPIKESDNFIRIRLCGTPTFGNDGSLTFE